MLRDRFSSKSLFFITTHFQLLKKKKLLQKHQLRLYLATEPHIKNLYWKISLLSFRSQLQHLPLHHLSAFKIGQTIFITPRLNTWNRKFPIGSLYECTSIQKISGIPSQFLDDGAVSPRDESSYGRDCGYRYSLPDAGCKNCKK